MPASTLDPVSSALCTALKKENNFENLLDIQMGGSIKKTLLSNIEFELAGSYQTTVLEKLKTKYIVLKNLETPKSSKFDKETANSEKLKVAKHELFKKEAIQLGWKNCDWGVGAGMINMGNTCYLNSTLQALFHVPALVNWLMSDKEHSSECKDSGDICIICAMRKTLHDSQQHNTNAIRPILIYNKLRFLCRNFIPGRQEDSHEFLRYLVEAMEKSYLSRFKNHNEFDSKTKETTPLNQILGGYLRSTVRCLKCCHISTTFQHFQDLLLDIRKAQTLDEALDTYFSREKLDDESYQCESCQKKVPATKQFSLERSPMVLCIQLKRFSVSNNKITKHITFKNRLDLSKYARERPNIPLIYRFVALVTHIGPTVSCGHYTAVAQAPSGNYYQFDDSMVRPISHQAVFNTNPYIMLFELESLPHTPASPTTAKRKPQIPIEKISLKNSIEFTPRDTNCKITKDTYNQNGQTTNGLVLSNLGNGNEIQNNKPSDSLKGALQLNNHAKDISSTLKQVADSTSNNKQPLSTICINGTNMTEKLPSNDSNSCSTVFTKKTNGSESLFVNKSLVPYETEDTSCSDDSSQSIQGDKTNVCVSTNSTVGDWHVTSSTDVAPELSSDEKNWNKKKVSLQVVNDLFKMSHKGYSGPVASWNGTRSILDKEINNERREERKRTISDSSDQGRSKNLKIVSNFKSNPGYNPIQEFHNAKNWSQTNGVSRYKSFNKGGSRYRGNFPYKKNHKNFRFRQ